MRLEDIYVPSLLYAFCLEVLIFSTEKDEILHCYVVLEFIYIFCAKVPILKLEA